MRVLLAVNTCSGTVEGPLHHDCAKQAWEWEPECPGELCDSSPLQVRKSQWETLPRQWEP